MWIHRDISPLISRLVTQRPVVVVTGARQVGKTTLLKRLLPSHQFASLDLPLEAALAEEQPKSFLAQHPPPLLIDEVQYAPGVFRHVKVDVDAHREQAGRFVLTGSQKFLLMKAVSDSLAGRSAVVELEPLSFREIERAFPGTPVEAVIVRGGFPELWANSSLVPADYYRAYLATYLERDVRALVKVGSLRDFERFVRACALRSGQLLNKSELARDVGVSAPTANEWLGVLVASNQVVLLEPWFSNRTKSMVKSPKLYWSDPGFLTWLLGIRDEAELLRSPLAGAIWETFVCAELRRRQLAVEGGTSLHFWRDRGREVDFVIHRGGRFELMEAKFTADPTRRDATQLAEVAALIGGEVAAQRILCRTAEPVHLGPVVALNPCAPWFDGDTW
jgi:predicted AAA+ superfamily ATPase